MPVGEYFGGHGEEVMAQMKEKHGERGEEVFYRTANKQGQSPHNKTKFPRVHSSHNPSSHNPGRHGY